MSIKKAISLLIIICVVAGIVIILVQQQKIRRLDSALHIARLPALSEAKAGKSLQVASTEILGELNNTGDKTMPSKKATENPFKYVNAIVHSAPGNLRLQQNRIMVQRTFAIPLKTLGLTAEQERRAKELLVERLESATDAYNITRTADMTIDEKAKAINDAYTAVDKELTAALGDETAKKVLEMTRMTDAYFNISKLYGADMSYSDAPLTPEQTVSLAQVLYNHYFSRETDPNYRAERTTSIDSTTGLSEVDKAALSECAGFLSPRQVEVLREDLSIGTASLAGSQVTKK